MDQGQNDNKKLTNQAKDLARKQAKKQMGRMAKIIVTKITGLLAVLFTQFWWVIALTVLGGMILDFAVEIISAKNTPEEIASKLEIDGDTMASLVEVKGDDKSGYYLSFAEDTDAKLDEIVKDFNSKAGVRNIPNKEFLKKIIKAEVITQFPNLGGNIPNGEDGFQGSVKIRRVSPNKDIGEMKNTGVGETTTVGEDEVFDTNVIGNYEEVIKVWEKGRKITLRADAKVYEQTESKLNPGSDTGDWHGVYDEKTSGTLTWKKGTIVEYTGTYKNNKNPTTGDVVTYVEVKNKDKVGFVKAWFLQEAEEEKEQLEKEENDKSQPNENEEEGKKEATIVKTTARAKNNGKEKIGGTKSEYVVAIAAGHSKEEPGAEGNGLNEEVLTIEVAEKVEELIKQKYSNVKVVQTGSTANKGVKAEERKQLAREANPDLCIQIHFNSATSADATGVEVIYKKNDGISQQLAEILTKSISTEMGLTDRGAAADVDRAAVGSLGIIENAALSGFPSVVTEGGFISGTNDSQVIKNGGVEKYAEGIVKGIKEYLEADHSGYTSTAPEEITETESINSIVQNLKYVPQEKMREYIDNNDKKALELFSLDEEQNLITATWNKTADGKVSITENAPMNLKNALNKYVLPYEYLLYFYIDIDDMEFSDALADKVINDTEIVIALQDNVTTNKSVITKQERREDEQPSKSFDWRDTSSVRTEISETCSTTVSITYVDTWCVKAYQKNSFSDKFLNMGNQDKKEINIPGTVTETKSQIIGNEVKDKTVTYTEVKKVPVASNNSNASEAGKYEEIEETYTYTTYTREKTDSHTISNTYDQGEKKIQGKENVFCELYKEFNMIKRVRTSYLFNILSNNDRTANLLDLTKYLIYKATNVSYGVVEFDWSIFEIVDFKSTADSSIDLLVEYIRYFEHASPPPMNADKTKYIIENDGAGNAVVGYGVDIFNGGFAEEFKQAGFPTNIGGEVDIAFVDGLEKRTIQEMLEAVKSMTSGLNLTGYQINALVSRAYNCGVGGGITTKRGSPSKNFVDSYIAYWNETDDQFEVKNPNANFSHSLYTQYMSKPVTSNGEQLPGLVKRRKSEWTLFQTGYYDVLDKWHSSGGSIIECAERIHEYMEANQYIYCVYGGAGDECGKFGKAHGLNVTFEESKTGYHNTCCATYVSWVLQEAGYITREDYSNGADTLSNNLRNKGFIEIYNRAELQPGDILSYKGHVEIYAGDNTIYNAGSGNAIRNAAPSPWGSKNPVVGLRAPN